MSDLLDVEKVPKVENSLVLTYKKCICVLTIFVCRNSDTLHKRLVFTLKLSTTCINQCYIQDKLALVICSILIICNLNMALHLK